MALCKLDIIPIKYNTFVFIVICALFAGFVLLGIVNCAKASKMKLLIPKEQEKTEKITQWLSENITDAFIEKWTDDSVTEMETILRSLLISVRVFFMNFQMKKLPFWNIWQINTIQIHF